MSRNLTALNTFMKSFNAYFNLEGVTDICINRPKEIWIEREGVFYCEENALLHEDFLGQFGQLVAEANSRELSREMPTLSAVLPNGLRVQFVIPPACEEGSFVCAIRQKAVQKVKLTHYFLSSPLQQHAKDLLNNYLEEDYESFLIEAVLAKKNILIAGGTGTGKTTFVNSLLTNIPLQERMITIETDREVVSPHRNSAHLLAAEAGQGVANISMLGLLKATLRLRPDRILLSEIRDHTEAYPFLRAINSGHPGSMTTIHADSPEQAFEQLAFMMLQGGSQLPYETLIAYAKSIISIVVQIKKDAANQRYISEIYYQEAVARSRMTTRMGVAS